MFGPISSDIGSKVNILNELISNNKPEDFSSMKKMVEYETKSGKLKDSSYVSGSRTLLRLHRGLEFLKEFLKRISELQAEDKTNTVGQDVYHQTLAKYHPWLIQKGALLAMYVLPTRDALLSKTCGSQAQYALEILPTMLESIDQIYNRVEVYYREKDLLNLP